LTTLNAHLRNQEYSVETEPPKRGLIGGLKGLKETGWSLVLEDYEFTFMLFQEIAKRRIEGILFGLKRIV
jgi:hypothetical protein